VVDTAAIASKIDKFNENLSILHRTVEMTKPVLQNMKNVLALQWFLGNAFLIIMFICTGIVLFLHTKSVKKRIPNFKISVWYVLVYIFAFGLMLLLFNFLPGLGTDHAYNG
jgi:small-conductance mechanosensitive channel